MAGRLTGKTALVTGASSGIGAAIATAFAAEGSHVLINYLDDEPGAQTLAAHLRGTGARAETFQADVSAPEQVGHLFDYCRDTLGGLDVLVNNASTEVNKPLRAYREEDWDRTIDSTLKSVFLCSQQAQKQMVLRGGGSIINISSIHDTRARIDAAPYCAAKAGVLMLTKSYALELARDNIRVNAISPGLILTNRVAGDFALPDGTPNLEKPLIRKIPLQRAGLAEELCEPAIYLASDLSSYTTGTTLYVDGGLSIAP